MNMRHKADKLDNRQYLISMSWQMKERTLY